MKIVLLRRSYLVENNISHFTSEIGGHWKEVGILCDELLEIHSFRKASGEEWDCINGYRTPLTTVTELRELKKKQCCCDKKQFKTNRLITVASRLYASKRYANYVDAAIEARNLIQECEYRGGEQ